MVQDQLTDYISSQIKLGVSRDAIKAALVSAGWVAADVEDTLKKAEGSAPAQAAAKPASQPVVSVGSAKPAAASATATPAKSGEPQMIRVSDLVSSSKMDSVMASGKISGNTFEATSPAASGSGSGSGMGGKKMLIVEIVGGVLVLLFAGLAWYFYSGNSGLAAQVASLNNNSAQVNSQLTSLQNQYSVSSTSYAAQINSLTATNSNLALELSFYVAPAGGATSTPILIKGTLAGGGKTAYVLMTADNAKISVANSADVKVSAALKPLIGQTVTLSGGFVPGSDAMTVGLINDVDPHAAVATTTAATAATSTPAGNASSTQ